MTGSILSEWSQAGGGGGGGGDTASGLDKVQSSDIKNPTDEDSAELYTIYQESFDTGYIP